MIPLHTYSIILTYLAHETERHYLCSMKRDLKENGGLPAHILWTLAIVAGVSVANLYYNQPLA